MPGAHVQLPEVIQVLLDAVEPLHRVVEPDREVCDHGGHLVAEPASVPFGAVQPKKEKHSFHQVESVVKAADR